MRLTRRGILAAVVSILVALVMAGCGKPTIEGQKKRYTETKDRIEAYATKNPAMKLDIQKKVVEFEVEYKAAEAKAGEEAISAIGAVVSRMEKYEKELKPAEPAAGAPATAQPAPGSKLGGTAPPPTPAAPAVGGKLGGTAPAPAPTVAPAPTPAAPSGGSGFGGQ